MQSLRPCFFTFLLPFFTVLALTFGNPNEGLGLWFLLIKLWLQIITDINSYVLFRVRVDGYIASGNPKGGW